MQSNPQLMSVGSQPEGQSIANSGPLPIEAKPDVSQATAARSIAVVSPKQSPETSRQSLITSSLQAHYEASRESGDYELAGLIMDEENRLLARAQTLRDEMANVQQRKAEFGIAERKLQIGTIVEKEETTRREADWNMLESEEKRLCGQSEMLQGQLRIAIKVREEREEGEAIVWGEERVRAKRVRKGAANKALALIGPRKTELSFSTPHHFETQRNSASGSELLKSHSVLETKRVTSSGFHTEEPTGRRLVEEGEESSVMWEMEDAEDAEAIEAEQNRLLQEMAKLRERKVALEKKALEAREAKTAKVREMARMEGAENGMVWSAWEVFAFCSRHDFGTPRDSAPGSEVLGSRPVVESYLSYSYRTGRERLSLHESAPGSRWPQRLSAQRNCGFAGGIKRGLRRDAVNEASERAKGRRNGRRTIPVPLGLQEAAMRRGVKTSTSLEGLEGSEEEEVYYSAEEGDDFPFEQEWLEIGPPLGHEPTRVAPTIDQDEEGFNAELGTMPRVDDNEDDAQQQKTAHDQIFG